MAKIGVIGVGYWGKNLARNLNDLEELAAICDDNPNNLDTVGRDYPNVKRYSDITEMLADPDIGAVAVATPAATHGSVTRQALNARKHVFVEKPLCLDLEEAGELKLLADRQNRTLMVGHMMLYHPAFQSLLNTVRDAALYEGEITVLNQAAEVECAILEGFLGRRVELISLHRPRPVLLGYDQPIAGRIHSYQPKFFSEMGYCSDSRGGWHHGHPFDHVAVGDRRAMQLLTHPIWWTGAYGLPEEKLRDFIEISTVKLDVALAEQCDTHRAGRVRIITGEQE